jgi:putative endonuclease
MFGSLSPQTLGKLGEDRARHELARRGYAILATRYRTRFGEIDIVCEHQGAIVFVEVKTRRSMRHGGALEAIPYAKRRKIAAMAVDFMAHGGYLGRTSRFDVVAIDYAGQPAERVRVIEGAFRPGDWRW